MIADGLFADAQALCDLAVVEALSNQFQHLALTLCQVANREIVDRSDGLLWRNQKRAKLRRKFCPSCLVLEQDRIAAVQGNEASFRDERRERAALFVGNAEVVCGTCHQRRALYFGGKVPDIDLV